MTERRVCAWCRGPIPGTARRDSVCCSVRCRQARHRYTRGVGSGVGVAVGHPRRIAYADPPYPGKSFYYRGHRDYGGEVDHAELLSRLAAYDAWALSTSAEALQDVLALAPAGARVAAWHRGHRVNNKASVPLNSWEPVIYGGDVIRRAQLEDGSAGAPALLRVDSLVYAARARTTDPERVIGAKPAAFWGWLFALLAATPADDFTDLFPGSGGGDRAWATWTGAE